MVVKITQEQADYLKTFEGDRRKAIHFISRWGFGHGLNKGDGVKYDFNENKPFEQGEVEKMLNAIINGYEVDVPKFKFFNISDITSLKRLYYAGKDVQLTVNIFEAVLVEKDSEEYKALLALGFVEEEV